MDDRNIPATETPDDNTTKKNDTESGAPRPQQYQHQPYERTARPGQANPQQPDGRPYEQGRGPFLNPYQANSAYHQPSGPMNTPAAPGRHASPGPNQAQRQQPPNPYPSGNPAQNQASRPYPPQAYGYPPQPSYPYNMYQAAYPPYGRAPNTGKATASLVLGIVSLVFAWISMMSLVALPCAIVGLILGIIARRELPPEHGRGIATAGMICSIIGIVLAVLMLTVSIYLIVSAVGYGADLSPFYGV